MSVDVLLSRLDKVKPRGKGSWMACCPSHADSSPSLVISLADTGSILIHCFAGCSAANVLDAVGLDMSVLFSDDFLTRHRKLIDFEQKSKQIKQKQAQEIKDEFGDDIRLGMYDEMRKAGQKLTPKELDLERQAFLRTRQS